MICVKDAAMDAVHLSVEWYEFTGLDAATALGRGWLQAVHHDDRAVVDRVLDAAALHKSGYSMVYRLLHRGGFSIWVYDGAVASFSPQDGTFIGLLGSITEVGSDTDKLVASGSIGSFRPPPPMPSTMVSGAKDLMADYLLLARSLAEQSGERAVIETLDIALYLTRKRLGRTSH